MNAQMQLMLKPESSFTPVQAGQLHRKQRGAHELGEDCPRCREGLLNLKRSSANLAEPSSVPPVVHEVLNSPGQPLDTGTRAFMEPRFGHDFSRVRVHTDSKAAESTRAVNARAFTVGNDVVFGEGWYRPAAHEGRKLLAHELAHTIQQSGQTGTPMLMDLEVSHPASAPELEAENAARSIMEGQFFDGINSRPAEVARQDDLDAGTPEIRDAGLPGGVTEPEAPPQQAPPSGQGQAPEQAPVQTSNVTHGSQWSMCNRRRGANLRASGFTGDTRGTYISAIQVDIHANNYSDITLTWANGNLSSGTLPTSFHASPGAGLCTTDCSDRANSTVSGSHCTEIGNFTVQGYGCHLGSYPDATFVTWFNYVREIAFHYYNVPAYPASHGCVRLPHEGRGAEWIYDNTLAGVTSVTVNRDASEGPGPKCWRGGRLINRPSPKKPSPKKK